MLKSRNASAFGVRLLWGCASILVLVVDGVVQITLRTGYIMTVHADQFAHALAVLAVAAMATARYW